MKHLFLTTVLTLAAFIAVAQEVSIDTRLSWKATAFINADNGETTNLESEFITIPGEKIIWKQDNGSKVYEFVITQKEGSWSSVLSDGSVKFIVTRGSVTGNIYFKRENNVTKVLFEFIEDGKNTMPFEFRIQQVQPAQ